MKDRFPSVSSLRQTQVCSDCIERDDIHIAGYPLPGRRGRVRHCMGCGGTGRQRTDRVDVISWFVSLEKRES
jgi:hypothetical protein